MRNTLANGFAEAFVLICFLVFAFIAGATLQVSSALELEQQCQCENYVALDKALDEAQLLLQLAEFQASGVDPPPPPYEPRHVIYNRLHADFLQTWREILANNPDNEFALKMVAMLTSGET